MSTWLSYHNQGAAREAASSRRFPPAAAAAAAAVFVYPHGVRSAAAHTHKTDSGRWPGDGGCGNFMFYVDVTAQCVVVFQGVG